MRKSICDRFEEKYMPEPNSGCWLWIGATAADGRGYIRVGGRKGKVKLATHVSLELVGRKLDPGKFALHRCDTPACVNPDHLFSGSYYDNSQDCIKKTRNAFGERAGMAKLNPKLVLEVRKEGAKIYALARANGVSPSTLYYARRYDTWRSVK